MKGRNLIGRRVEEDVDLAPVRIRNVNLAEYPLRYNVLRFRVSQGRIEKMIGHSIARLWD